MVYDLHFPDFIYLLAIGMSSLEKCLFSPYFIYKSLEVNVMIQSLRNRIVSGAVIEFEENLRKPAIDTMIVGTICLLI